MSGAATTRRWLDDAGAFLFGKYRGDLAGDVARDDSAYVRWVVDTVDDIDDTDRDALTAMLTFRRYTRR